MESTVAASFKIFGKRNEWTARLPSALCVLAVAIAFVTVARGSLGASGSLIGALVWMTNFGIVQHNFFIFFNAAIGLLFLRRANRELFGSANPSV